MSLHDWPLFGGRTFIGIKNYIDLFSDNDSLKSMGFYSALHIGHHTADFYSRIHSREFGTTQNSRYRYLSDDIFLPVVIGLGTSSLLWVWLLNDQVGIINKILMDVGAITKPQLWLAKPDTAMNVIILSVIWKTVGFTMVLLLAGMQSIPTELYKSAEVDGAGYWHKLRFITLPLLRRTIALALVLSVIGSILAFDQFFIITGGGPRNSTISIVYWIFNNSFTYFKMGYGASMSIVLMVVLVLLSAVQLFLLRDNTNS